MYCTTDGGTNAFHKDKKPPVMCRDIENSAQKNYCGKKLDKYHSNTLHIDPFECKWRTAPTSKARITQTFIPLFLSTWRKMCQTFEEQQQKPHVQEVRFLVECRRGAAWEGKIIIAGSAEWSPLVQQSDHRWFSRVITAGSAEWSPLVQQSDHRWFSRVITAGSAEWSPLVQQSDHRWFSRVITAGSAEWPVVSAWRFRSQCKPESPTTSPRANKTFVIFPLVKLSCED